MKLLTILIFFLLLLLFINAEPFIERNRNITKVLNTTYTSTTKTTTYSNKEINVVVYTGIKYSDSNGTLVGDTPSLMKAEFPIPINIQQDPKYPVKILDYNLTSIKLSMDISESTETLSLLNTDIPIELYAKANTSNKFLDTSIKFTDSKEVKENIYPFGIGKVLKIGSSSTLITLNSTASEDLYIYDATLDGIGFVIKVNITTVPTDKEIVIAKMCLTAGTDSGLGKYWSNDTDVYRMKNQTWVEATPANQIAVIGLDNKTTVDFPWWFTQFGCFNASTQLGAEIADSNDWMSLRVEDPAHPIGTISTIGDNNKLYLGDLLNGDYNIYEDTEGSYLSTNYPYLNFTYLQPDPPSGGGCNCTFPNSYSVPKVLNLSCNCTTSVTSWCSTLSFIEDGNWTVNAEVNTTTVNFTNFETGDKIFISNAANWSIG